MTVIQIVKDALTWCRYFAVESSVDESVVRRLFYEAFQSVYDEAVVSHPEYFTVSASFSGTSWTIPANFRKEILFEVVDAGATQGYATPIDPAEWDNRQASTRNNATTLVPMVFKGSTTFTIAPSVTTGKVYYIRNYAESDLNTDSTDLETLLPLVYQPLLLVRMQELIRVRHLKLPESPEEMQRMLSKMNVANKFMKRSLKPLEIIEGLGEKPQSVQMAQ